jgi:hypothetical protein
MPDALIYQGIKMLPEWMVAVSERFDNRVNGVVPSLGRRTLCPAKKACDNIFFDNSFDSQLLFVSL